MRPHSRSPARAATCASCACRSACRSRGPGPARRAGRRRAGRCAAATTLFRSGDRSSRSTPCAPASSRPACRPRTGATRSPASRWPASCSGWTASAHDQPHLRRGGAGGLAGLRDPVLATRGAVARVHRAAAPVPQDHEPRDRARPRRDAAARQHARRGAAGGLPAEPDPAAAGARLLGVGAGAAHDTRGDRQLPRPEARNREPRFLASSRTTGCSR